MGTRGPVKGAKRAAAAASGRPVSAPKIPTDLEPEARKIWRRLVPEMVQRGVELVPADGTLIADLCRCYLRLAECEAEIDRHGILVEGARGGLVRNPAILAARAYRDQIARLSAKFGLTPLDRARLPLAGQEEEQSLAEILFAGALEAESRRTDEAPRAERGPARARPGQAEPGRKEPGA